MNSDITFREKQIINLISHGFNAAEIGVRLKISKRTVEKYTGMVILKLNAKNSCHVVRIAIYKGIIDLAKN